MQLKTACVTHLDIIIGLKPLTPLQALQTRIICQ